MVKFLLLFYFFASSLAFAQVKPEYLYNTTLPFGTLDIRTRVSSTEYYYLRENITFSFRESSPGVRTNTFADITSWDSSPYGEGHMRKRIGSRDDFIMNYRLLKPLNYNAELPMDIPLIVIMHGAVERGNCYYEECYHADWNYNPNNNVPPAPTNADSRLLNNDYHLTQSAREHLAARNLAGTRLPDDPSMPSRAFPGFVLMPQMLNVWDSLTVEDMIRVVQLHIETYNIDPNRVYIHGLSIGGYATYEAIKRAPWLFAAALPMSAVSEAGNIFRDNQQNKVVHMPLWTFQGGLDDDPSPAFTQNTVNRFRAAGASMQYTVYPDLSHRVWGRAYAEPNFFTWILSKRKNQLHILHGVTQIDAGNNVFPKLMLAEGFFAYQWEKDGALITGANANALTINSPGSYRARFSRTPSPGSADWNSWSQTVVITSVAVEPPPVEEPPPAEEPPPTEEPPTEPEEPGEETPPAEEPGEETPPAEEPVEETPPVEEPVEETPPTEEPETPPVSEEPPPVGEQPVEEPVDPIDEEPPPVEEPVGEEPPVDQPDPGNENPIDEVDDPDFAGNDDDGDGEVTALENEREVTISIYPNPSRGDRISILLNGIRTGYTIRIVDMLGKVKYEQPYSPNNAAEITLNDANLKDGVYSVIVSSDGIYHTSRIVIRGN